MTPEQAMKASECPEDGCKHGAQYCRDRGIHAEAARERRIIDAGHPHGVDDQLNVLVLDVDSSVTNYGRHNRLVVMRDVADPTLLTVREDLRGLPMSTETDQRRAANGWQRLHPRWSRLEHLRSVPYTIAGFGDCIDHEYRIH